MAKLICCDECTAFFNMAPAEFYGKPLQYCELCEAIAIDLGSIRKHYIQDHGYDIPKRDSRGRFSCKKLSNKPYIIIAHRRLILTDRIDGFDSCGLSYPSTANFAEHIASFHDANFFFQCPHLGCTKRYNCCSNIKHHIKVAHSRDKYLDHNLSKAQIQNKIEIAVAKRQVYLEDKLFIGCPRGTKLLSRLEASFTTGTPIEKLQGVANFIEILLTKNLITEHDLAYWQSSRAKKLRLYNSTFSSLEKQLKIKQNEGNRTTKLREKLHLMLFQGGKEKSITTGEYYDMDAEFLGLPDPLTDFMEEFDYDFDPDDHVYMAPHSPVISPLSPYKIEQLNHLVARLRPKSSQLCVHNLYLEILELVTDGVVTSEDVINFAMTLDTRHQGKKLLVDIIKNYMGISQHNAKINISGSDYDDDVLPSDLSLINWMNKSEKGSSEMSVIDEGLYDTTLDDLYHTR